VRRRDQVLALGEEAGAAIAPAPGVQAAQRLEPWVVGGGDLCHLGGGVGASAKEKGAVLVRSDARELSMSVPV